jgi:CubicO group peptidase (beta-lactamase class C family)
MIWNYQRIQERFIENVVKKGFNAGREDIAVVLNEIEPILQSSIGIEEKIAALFSDINNKVVKLMDEYPIPGWNFEVNTDVINASSYGGVLDATGRPMKRNAIFDTSSSASKLAAQLISYHLTKEGYYDFDDKASDLCPKFSNSGDLTMGQIMGFLFSYSFPDGRKFEKANSVEEAKDILYSMGVNKQNEYAYIDFGMMALKEIMENVTGMSYEELVKKYIIGKLGLKNTFLIVPEDKRDLLTGTPNALSGYNNDKKSIISGGYSGNAGIQADSADLLKIINNLYINNDFFPSEYLPHVYTESEYSKKCVDGNGKPDPWRRGIMGNACTAGGSFVDRLSPFDASAFQGSTRVQMNAGTYGNTLVTSTTLLNPASMGLERARETEQKLNKRFVDEYSFEGKDYIQISSQLILPTGKVVGPLTKEMARLSLKLAFLDAMLKEERNVKKINVEMENGVIKK